MEREKGIEFIAPHEMPETWRQAVAYRKHVDSGGERLPAEVIAPTKLPKSTVKERIRNWFGEQRQKNKIVINP